MWCISVGSNDFSVYGKRTLLLGVLLLLFFFLPSSFRSFCIRWSERINCCLIFNAHARVLDYNEKESIIFVVVVVIGFVGGGTIDGTVDIIRWGMNYILSVHNMDILSTTDHYKYVSNIDDMICGTWTTTVEESKNKTKTKKNEEKKNTNPNISA